MAGRTAVAGPFARITNQPRVTGFLSSAASEGLLSHAYLFLGIPGCGKHECAVALAQMVCCPNGGDGTCDDCIRIAHHTHPDVTFLEPASAMGYLVEQVRDLVADVALSPVRSKRKVYVIGSADMLRDVAANALLKTIEEPPPHVMFILMARSADAVLPTLVSRCQQVPFRVVSTDAALEAIVRRSGADERDAAIAYAVTGSSERAVQFLASAERRNVRRMIVKAVLELERDDSWDVIEAAREICEVVGNPYVLARKRKSNVTEEESEFLTAGALRKVEEARKRELSVRERASYVELVGAVESLLRDVLATLEQTSAAVVNADVQEGVSRMASVTTVPGVLGALRACSRCLDDIAHNVTPQLAIEVMLLSIKEALACRTSFR